jgi:DNA-binding beta-propeller fold protein YncE
MTLRCACWLLVTWSLVASLDVIAAEPTIPRSQPFDLQTAGEFFKLPNDWSLGACAAVAVNGKGEVFVFHRGRHPILCFDASGRYLRSWGDDLIGSAHGLRIDGNDDVWVTDIGNHRVYKFDAQGKVLLALGTGKPGDAPDQFNKPTDVAFGPDGEFYVSDGYGNSRVLKFSPSGALLQAWGTPGKAPGQFHLPHSIVIDSQSRVLVGDRENDRIQIFTREGRFIDAWPGFAPYGLALDAEGTLLVADGRANQVLRLDSTGKVAGRWGAKGKAAGQFDLPHMLCFDAAGAVYVAEVGGQRVQKLLRR